MKVLFVSNCYMPKKKATEGFQVYLYRVAEAMADLGHKPIIVASGKREEHYYDGKIEIYVMPFHNLNFPFSEYELAFNHIRMSWKINKKIRRICYEKKIDIIQFPSIGGLALFYCGKVPAVLRLSSYAKIAYVPNQTLSAKQIRNLCWLERQSAKRCKAVFAPCQITAQYFAADIQRKVAVIETPFINDVSKYNNTAYEKYLSSRKYVLFFGRLYVEKGILVIKNILHDFFEINRNYNIVFCGKEEMIQGKSAKLLLSQAAGEFCDRVIFFDALPHEKLYPIIRGADFVILPSLMENFSNACIEAMYFEKVVIGTEGASFEQLIQDGKNGMLCKIGDSKSLLEKMNYVVNLDEEKKKEIGKEARKRIDLLRPEIAVKRLIRFYKRILNQ